MRHFSGKNPFLSSAMIPGIWLLPLTGVVHDAAKPGKTLQFDTLFGIETVGKPPTVEIGDVEKLRRIGIGGIYMGRPLLTFRTPIPAPRPLFIA
jgi:hypothetical protein